MKTSRREFVVARAPRGGPASFPGPDSAPLVANRCCLTAIISDEGRAVE